MDFQLDSKRTNWTIYHSREEANIAAQEEANATGIPQYSVRKPTGFIVTPEHPPNVGAVPFNPDMELTFDILKVPTVRAPVPAAEQPVLPWKISKETLFGVEVADAKGRVVYSVDYSQAAMSPVMRLEAGRLALSNARLIVEQINKLLLQS